MSYLEPVQFKKKLDRHSRRGKRRSFVERSVRGLLHDWLVRQNLGRRRGEEMQGKMDPGIRKKPSRCRYLTKKKIAHEESK